MSQDKKKPQPGDKGYQAGVFTTRIYSPGKNIEVTTVKDDKGNVKVAFVRDLFLGIF